MKTRPDSSRSPRHSTSDTQSSVVAYKSGNYETPQADSLACSPFSLEGKTVLVTGGGTGIGLAIAKAAHRAGASVAIVGRRENVLENAIREIGGNAVGFAFDVSEPELADELVDHVKQRFGRIDCLVNNAGLHLKKPAVEHSASDFRRVLDTHVIGSHALSAAVAPAMVEQGEGSIIFIASMASLFGIPQVVAYSAAKSAFLGMARTMATELSPDGVRVNVVAPGWIETEMSGKALAGDPQRSEKILSRTPMRRFGQPSEVGEAVVFLASPAASFITGAVLPVDGGASIGF